MRIVLTVLCLLVPATVWAQSAPSGELAGVRAELTQLNAEIQALRTQASAEIAAAPQAPQNGPTVLRLDQIEADMRALTGRVEQLSNRINSIASDGTRRIADLEFRLVELEGGDISTLGETSTLGGEMASIIPAPAVQPEQPQMQLAVSEEADFDSAQQSLGDGQYANAILQFGQFLSDYPGGPLTARAMYHMGEAQTELGQHKEAARSFLDSFTAAPKGEYAPQALLRVGVSLGELGKVTNACQTWAEVVTRYPDSGVIAQARENQQKFGCS